MPHLFRSKRAQWGLIVVFTAAFSYMVGTIASFYDSTAVWQAIVTALTITVGLTLLTFQLKVDITKYWGILFAVTIGFIMFGLIRLIVPSDPVVDTVYAAIGAVLFSVYIVFDTQFMLKYLDDDDYLLAALNIYTDVMNLFLMLLSLLGDN
jgi:FtsH-binding integral membrane protein